MAIKVVPSSSGVQGTGENGEGSGTPSAGGTIQTGSLVGVYVPGTMTFPGWSCLAHGDRIRFKNLAWVAFEEGVSDLVPDADLFMPHFAVRDGYAAGADPRSNERTRDPKGGQYHEVLARRGTLFGNDPYRPVIRHDLSPFVVQGVGAEFSVEGGDGPGGGPDGPGALVFTWVWERGWTADPMAVTGQDMATLGARAPRPPGLAQPPNQRGEEFDVLTFNNVASGQRIYRPDFATKVWTPNHVDFTLDSGPGTTACVVSSEFGLPVSLGAYQFFVNSTDAALSVVQFLIPR